MPWLLSFLQFDQSIYGYLRYSDDREYFLKNLNVFWNTFLCAVKNTAISKQINRRIGQNKKNILLVLNFVMTPSSYQPQWIFVKLLLSTVYLMYHGHHSILLNPRPLCEKRSILWPPTWRKRKATRPGSVVVFPHSIGHSKNRKQPKTLLFVLCYLKRTCDFYF